MKKEEKARMSLSRREGVERCGWNGFDGPA